MVRSKPEGIDPTESIVWDSMPLEASAPLEAAASLDARDISAKLPVVRSQPSTPPPVPAPEAAPTLQSKPLVEPDQSRVSPGISTVAPNPQAALPVGQLIGQPDADYDGIPTDQRQPAPAPSNATERTTVRLLEERLFVDRKKRKVGDVIVRKEIETRIVEVPVRRETLIVEQISPEYKSLASIDLSDSAIEGVELLAPAEARTQPSVSMEFTSARAASQFLATIASQPEPGYQTVQVKIVVDSVEQKAIYQQWFDRYVTNQNLADTSSY